MKNIKRIKITLFVCLAALCLTSCTKWLELKPFDQILDDEVYSSERSINMALNGLYLSMADQSLYGKNLTYYTTELLGQRYNLGGWSLGLPVVLTRLPFFQYEYDEVASHLDAIFRKAYAVILNVNYFIEQVEKTDGVVIDSKKNILLGEAYALRAFMHFDMVRFYGSPPILGKEGIGVPYCVASTNEWQPILTNGEVLTLVLRDIERSIALLQNDAILTNGVEKTNDVSDFYRYYRNRRMNLFAVQALKMRVLIYAGDEESIQAAGNIAKELIESETFEKSFPWETDFSRVDDIYSNEVIFGINVSTLYEDWAIYYNTSASSQFSVLPTPFATLNYMYDSAPFTNSYDRRATQWQEFGLIANLYLSRKFRNPNNTTASHLYLQPLIKKSEVYLVAAEVFQEAKYIDAIRVHRGAKTLEEDLSTYDLQEQIRKEYMKEFVGEGQLFYYYKRRAETSIWGRAGSAITISLPESSYVPPMPKTETER